ncbi:MAG: sel1 repeat family protein, partial [Methylococcales bacterium]|nr:sel1 repeat family protein [Methylococcales bacterium]
WLYQYGKGVRYDEKEAARWYLRAAEQGSAKGQYNLGALYQFSIRGNKNIAEALQWYLKAANHGDVDAYLRLSELYQYGGGVPKDLVKAYQWAFIAAKKEGFSGVKAHSLIKEPLTETMINEGRYLAGLWLESH